MARVAPQPAVRRVTRTLANALERALPLVSGTSPLVRTVWSGHVVGGDRLERSLLRPAQAVELVHLLGEE